jgi:hypothetical protein
MSIQLMFMFLVVSIMVWWMVNYFEEHVDGYKKTTSKPKIGWNLYHPGMKNRFCLHGLVFKCMWKGKWLFLDGQP